MRKFGLALAFALLITAIPLFSGCNEKQENTTYTITCSYENGVLEGKEKVSFYNFTDNAFTELKFNLFGNAFRKNAKYQPISAQYLAKAYPNGVSYGEMTVKEVCSKGKALEFSVVGEDQNILSVKLENQLFPEERVEIEIAFTLKLANVVARTGYNDSTVNLGNFYPILCGIEDGSFYECAYYSSGDPFYSDVSDYTVSFTTPSKYVVASSGKLVKSKENGENTTYNYKISNARSFALALSENFKILSGVACGVKINYYYYDDQTPEQSLKYAMQSMDFFTETFGGYPYPTYSVVQTEFIQGGMEYPALVMISDELEPNAYGEVIVHETAHQWWQTTVGNNEIKYGFLDEGLAEYSVVLFYEKHSEYGMTRKQMITQAERTYKVFCSVSDKLFGKVDTSMLRSLGEYKSEYEYVNIAYVKPCVMYEYLRTTVGDARFFKALKRYYKTYALSNATPDDLVGAFEKTGADTNGFFQSFFNGEVVI